MAASIVPQGILLSADLFFSSQVTGAAAVRGLRVAVKSDAAAVIELLNASAVQFVIIDLGTPGLSVGGLLEQITAEPRPFVIAYDAHVRTDRLQAARDAGCDEVLSRGQFSAQLPAIIGRFAQP